MTTTVPDLKRRTVTLDSLSVINEREAQSTLRIVRTNQRPAVTNTDTVTNPSSPKQKLSHSPTVLVINASTQMARELTFEISTTIPGSNILFAPTLTTALWILKRRSIDIILTTAILPDAPLAKLHEFLELMSPPPELVVLSDLEGSREEVGGHPGYRFVELRRLAHLKIEEEQTIISDSVKTLGADLRNDLNNPLQEIVAMAFVAHASVGLSPSAEQALSAIQRAATNMATVVNSLEEKIASATKQNVA